MPQNIENLKQLGDKFGEIYYEWTISEHNNHKRSYGWYILMIIVSAALIIWSIITANFLFALIIILVIFILFLKEYSGSSQLKFRILEDGILIGNQFFSYKELASFYMIYDPPYVKKLFFSTKGLSPDISIPLNDMNPLPIRESLLEFLEEDLDKENESIDDQLETILKL
jgi:hypothetical protein